MRRRQEAIDHALVGVGAVVLEKGVNLVGGRRKADQVERRAANERDLVSLRRWGESRLLEAIANEGINRMDRHVHLGRLGPLRRGERPVRLVEPGGFFVVRSPGTFVDPTRQQADLLGGERGPFERHAFDRTVATHGFNQRRFGGFPRQNSRAGLAPLEGMGGGVETQPASRAALAMTGNAVFRQQGLDLLGIVDRRLGGRRRLGRDQAESHQERENAHAKPRHVAMLSNGRFKNSTT